MIDFIKHYFSTPYVELTPQDKFDILLYMYKKDFGYEALTEIIKKYHLGTLRLENNGDKGYLAREFKYRGIRVASYHERLNKHTKICTYAYRIWKKLKWLKQTDENYIGQVLDYTEMAEHDDCIDSLASLSYRFLASGKVVAVKGINI